MVDFKNNALKQTNDLCKREKTTWKFRSKNQAAFHVKPFHVDNKKNKKFLNVKLSNFSAVILESKIHNSFFFL